MYWASWHVLRPNPIYHRYCVTVLMTPPHPHPGPHPDPDPDPDPIYDPALTLSWLLEGNSGSLQKMLDALEVL